MLKKEFRRGDAVVYLDKPVNKYKTKEEMLDAIYALGSIDNYIDKDSIKVEIYDLDKYGYLIKDYVETSYDHLIPSFVFETFVSVVDRYWAAKENNN